jgi:EmrB/QacA subfamily drug resistance transporter
MSHIGRPPCDEGVIRGAGSGAPCARSAQRWVLAAAIIGSSMAFIDGTVVNVALPAMQRELHASASDMQWVVESYALFLAALLLVGGALGDRYGRRRIFVAGVALFAVASIACGLARDVTQLVAARALQGVGGALLVPGSLALISASFAPQERGKAIGTWSGYSSITAALGPLLGGFLVDTYSWVWAFFINVPLALAALAITWRQVPESRNDAGARTLDWAGAALATVGLGGIVYAFVEAPRRGWGAAPVLAALLCGLSALALFSVAERRSAAPMFPLGLFRSRNFSGANLLTLLLYAALGGGLFFLPLNLIQVQGYSATAAGAALLPFILIMFVLSRWAGTLVDRYGARGPLVFGPVIAGAGFALLALPGTQASYWSAFFPAIVVLGFGMTVSVAPLTTTVMNAVSQRLAGTASGVNNAVSRIAALLAIAIFGSVMAWAFQGRLETSLARANVPKQVRVAVEGQQDRLAGIELPDGLSSAVASAVREAVGASFVEGFRMVMVLCAGLAFMSALAGWRMIDGKKRSGSP